jgi:hypothetical protein
MKWRNGAREGSGGRTFLERRSAVALTLAALCACGHAGGGSEAKSSDAGGAHLDSGTDASRSADSSVGRDGSLAEAGVSDATPDTAAPARDGSNADGAGAGEAGATALGYMIGIKTNGVADGPATVQGWLGRPLDVAGTTINTNGYIGNGMSYVDENQAYPLLEVSFPLLSIFGENNGLTDMGQAAAGAYDSTYEAMSMALAAAKNPLLSARIGWEFNGNWYAWSNGVGPHATYANYIAAFQHAAQMIKKHNPHALIQWCIAWGQPDPTPFWPGVYDATTNPGGVDVVSMDFYQANISQYNNGGNQSKWALAQSGVTIDLDWMTTFAQSMGVKVALSEYGAGSSSSKGIGGGPGLDDGTWTAASIAWMNALPPGLFLWTSWSDDAPADDIVTAGANPAEQTAWTAAWKGTRFGGTWWPGTPPP